MKLDIFKSIRKNNIQIATLCLLILICMIPSMILSINNGAYKDRLYENLLVGSCFVIAPLIFFIRSVFFIIKPEKSDIIQIYGGIEGLEKVLDEINNTIEYQDEQIIVSKNYIVDKYKVENLIECRDIIQVKKWEWKRYGVLCAYRLVITKKYGTDIQYQYALGEEEKVDYLVDLISSKCKSGEVDNN